MTDESGAMAENACFCLVSLAATIGFCGCMPKVPATSVEAPVAT
jgi:hypothetical protein